MLAIFFTNAFYISLSLCFFASFFVHVKMIAKEHPQHFKLDYALSREQTNA